MSAPVLAYPDFNKPFLLTTDASDVAIGAVLEQVDSFGHAHPIAYFSRSLTSVQRRYSVMEKEGYALVESIRHFNIFVPRSLPGIHRSSSPSCLTQPKIKDCRRSSSAMATIPSVV